MAGLDFEESCSGRRSLRARGILLLSPSILVPCLTHDGAKVWDTLAIAEYLDEISPQAGLLPADARARALPLDLRRDAFRLRQSALPLPMNLKAHFPASRSGPARRPISTVSPRSGATACRAMAVPICSADS
jgi:glutathione S-transferase